jgi:hypothetical protein
VSVILAGRSGEVGTIFDNLGDRITSFLNIENFHRYDCNIQQQICGQFFPPY